MAGIGSQNAGASQGDVLSAVDDALKHKITQIAEDILSREGGFVNDPDDLGGATRHGVTIGTLRRLGLDLNQDQRIDTDDVKEVTPEIARRIFIEHYFIAPNIIELPELLWASVFDMYVNSGQNAVKILQRLLNEMRLSVAVDGVIGPKTVRAARQAADAAPFHLADAYGIARRNYYYDLGDKRAKNRKYIRRKDGGKGGWIARAEAFLAPKYHLSRVAHYERIAKWG